MEIPTIISIGIIVIIIFLVYTNGKPQKAEHFKIKIGKIGKGAKKGIKTVGKAITKTVGRPAKKTIGKVVGVTTVAAAAAAKAVTKKPKPTVAISNAAVLNSIAATKNIADDSDKIIKRTTKMFNETNKSIISLGRKIEQLNNRIKVGIQKKIFSVYLNRKAAAKIAQLAALIGIVSVVSALKTQKGARQIEILKKKILTQMYEVKIYVGRANSYNCYTKNLFYQIETGYNDIVDSNVEIQANIIKVNAMIENTRKNVVSANEKITSTNNQIIEASKPPPAPPAPEVDSTDAGSDAGDTSTDASDASADSTDAGADTEASSDSSEGGDSEVEGFALENISQLDPLVFDIVPIVFPPTIIIPQRQSIPIITAIELVTPQYTEPNLKTLFPALQTSLAPAPTPTTAQLDASALIDYQAESELEMILPKEEFIPIPSDADPLDIDNENELIYELS